MKEMPFAPQVTDGVTYVPVRFIPEDLGLNVYPDPAGGIVNI
jgi:hypothetical protein